MLRSVPSVEAGKRPALYRFASVRLHPPLSSLLSQAGANGRIFYFFLGITLHTRRLQTWTRREGTIRLSEDDGPPANQFLEDDGPDEDTGSEELGEHEAGEPTTGRPLAQTRIQAGGGREMWVGDGDADTPSPSLVRGALVVR